MIRTALAQAGLGAAYFTQYKNSGDATLRDSARAVTLDALKLNSDLAPGLVTMAQIDASMGYNDLALEKVKRVIQSNPRSPEAYAAQAEVYKSKGDLKDAIAAIQNAIYMDEDNSMWWVQQGNYYKSSGDIEAGAKNWQTAVDKDPENIFAWYDLGIANQLLGKLPKRARIFSRY